MLGGWQKEKGKRLTDVIKKRAWLKDYDGINRWHHKQQKGGTFSKVRLNLAQGVLFIYTFSYIIYSLVSSSFSLSSSQSKYMGVHWNHFVRLSIWPFVVLSVCPIVSVQYLLNCSTILFYSRFGMVVYYYEAMCHAEKLVHSLQCQGHSEGFYQQNLTIFTMSSKLLVCLQPNLVW